MLSVLYWIVLSYNIPLISNWWSLFLGVFSAGWYAQIHPSHETKFNWAVVNTCWLLFLKLILVNKLELNWAIIISPSIILFALELAYGIHAPKDGYSPGVFIFLYALTWFIILASYVSKSAPVPKNNNNNGGGVKVASV